MTRSRRCAPSLAVVALLGVVTACGSDDDSSTETTATTAPAVVTTETSAPVTTLAEGAVSVTADVTSDLEDQQILTVTSVGFDPGVWVVQCDIEDLRVCWTGTPATFDTFGTFVDGEAVIELRRIIPFRSDVDCAERPGRCVLRLATGDDVSLVPGAPLVELTFDPEVPTRSALDVSVTPNDALVDGQQVAIEVANLPDGTAQGVDIRTCSVEETPMCVALAVSDSPVVDGVVVVRHAVSRLLVDPAGERETVDCAVTPCDLRVRFPGSPLVAVPLAFDPDQPLPEEPQLELVPTDDPRAFQVLGQGLTPSTGLTVVVCLQARQTCVPVLEPIIAPDPAGRVDATITLPEQSEGVECIPGGCAFSIASMDPLIYLAPVYATG